MPKAKKAAQPADAEPTKDNTPVRNASPADQADPGRCLKCGRYHRNEGHQD